MLAPDYYLPLLFDDDLRDSFSPPMKYFSAVGDISKLLRIQANQLLLEGEIARSIEIVERIVVLGNRIGSRHTIHDRAFGRVFVNDAAFYSVLIAKSGKASAAQLRQLQSILLPSEPIYHFDQDVINRGSRLSSLYVLKRLGRGEATHELLGSRRIEGMSKALDWNRVAAELNDLFGRYNDAINRKDHHERQVELESLKYYLDSIRKSDQSEIFISTEEQMAAFLVTLPNLEPNLYPLRTEWALMLATLSIEAWFTEHQSYPDNLSQIETGTTTIPLDHWGQTLAHRTRSRFLFALFNWQ